MTKPSPAQFDLSPWARNPLHAVHYFSGREANQLKKPRRVCSRAIRKMTLANLTAWLAGYDEASASGEGTPQQTSAPPSLRHG